MLLGISVSTLPISRLLINPDIQATEEFEEWHIQPITLVLISISPISYIFDITHDTLPTCIRLSGPKGVMTHFDFMHKRTLRMYNLEKLFAARKIRLNDYASTRNVSYEFPLQM